MIARGLLVGTATAASLLVSAPAEAQSLRPNIMVIFDTSGSMTDNSASVRQTFDGSLVCDAADAADALRDGRATRIYNLKQALREALQEVGTDEANIGLMRFPTLERAQAPACSAVTVSPPSGGYSGHYYIDASTTVGARQGCKTSTHTSETAYGPGTWFDNSLRQILAVDVTRRPVGLKPVAADFDPVGANLGLVYSWIDLGESAAAALPVADPELRALSNTPLGRSLFYARMYFDNYVRPTDPKAPCRSNVVILVTDGAETCDLGGTFDPVTQANALRTMSQIPTYVLTDNSTGGDNDAIATAGGTAPAIRVDLTNSGAAKAALVGIIARTVRPAETCNGMDDNCNGLTDEGVSNKCAFDPTPARRHCAQEACDGVDNDCDGATDEGFPLDACGKPMCGTPPPEQCNGIDDNCDGDIDEGFMVGASCSTTGVGACKKFGTIVCKPGCTGSPAMCSMCDVPPGGGSPEICNGIDDDCDGMTDEREGGVPLPGEGEVCGVSVGTCMSGMTICRNGRLECDATSMPGMEICNGIDDNCNGIVDDGVPDIDKECLCPGLDNMKAMTGTCKPGKLKCRGMMGLVCEGCVVPTTELCDGKDNDCDGVTDFMASCPNGFGCKGGRCNPECRTGEFPCEAGFECLSGFCVATLCAGVMCPDGHRCEAGACIDPCAGKMCPGAGSRCVDGICENCHTLGCLDGKICVAGECTADLCSAAACTLSEYCSAGTCVSLCAKVKCPDGQTCAAGQCRADLCEGKSCSSGVQFCTPATGMCKDNPCLTTPCPPGRRCVPTTGECAPDPCDAIRCVDQCSRCDTTADGVGHCVAEIACQANKTYVRAGKGCGCHLADASPSPATLIFLLGLAALLVRARRR